MNKERADLGSLEAHCVQPDPHVEPKSAWWFRIAFPAMKKNPLVEHYVPEDPLPQEKPVGPRKNPGLPTDLRLVT